MKHHIIFLVFALVIFHKYRPEQRIPSFFSSTRTFRINFQEVLFQTPAPPPTTQQVVVWYAKSCIIKLSSWDRSVVLEQKYFHGPVVPNTFWRLLLCKNKQPSWTHNRKVKNIGPKRWKKVWNKKQKVTFALSLVGDRIPEVGNTYEQRRSYYVEVLTHTLVSHRVRQVLWKIAMQN